MQKKNEKKKKEKEKDTSNGNYQWSLIQVSIDCIINIHKESNPFKQFSISHILFLP